MCRGLTPPKSRPARRTPRVRTWSGPKSWISYMSGNSGGCRPAAARPMLRGFSPPKDRSPQPVGLLHPARVPEGRPRLGVVIRLLIRRGKTVRPHKHPRPLKWGGGRGGGGGNAVVVVAH